MLFGKNASGAKKKHIMDVQNFTEKKILTLKLCRRIEATAFDIGDLCNTTFTGYFWVKTGRFNI